MNVILGILIPFFGTTLGASSVFFMKDRINEKAEKILLGFTTGVMLAATIWSLLIPSMEMTEKVGFISCIPAVVGFSFGILFLIISDKVLEKLQNKYIEKGKNENKENKLKKNLMLIFSITLHNIPEGMAVGVLFAGILSQNVNITLASAFSLSIGIALQNIPEGAIIALPTKDKKVSKKKSFLIGVLSGIVEPIGAIITIFFSNTIIQLLPYLLAFSGGAMMYVVIKELIPETEKGERTNFGILGVTIGFLLMMILDVSLG